MIGFWASRVEPISLCQWWFLVWWALFYPVRHRSMSPSNFWKRFSSQIKGKMPKEKYVFLLALRGSYLRIRGLHFIRRFATMKGSQQIYNEADQNLHVAQLPNLTIVQNSNTLILISKSVTCSWKHQNC